MLRLDIFLALLGVVLYLLNLYHAGDVDGGLGMASILEFGRMGGYLFLVFFMSQHLNQCDFARAVWHLASLNLAPLQYDIADFLPIIEYVVRNLDTYGLAVFCMITWRLRTHRNDVIWKNIHHRPAEVLRQAKVQLLEYCQTVERTKRVNRSVRAQDSLVWVAPVEGQFKLNIDGAIFQDQKCSGIRMGAVIRDSEGLAYAGISQKYCGFYSRDITEMLAVWTALSWALDIGFSSLQVETDCLQVVQAITGLGLKIFQNLGFFL
ncbi:Ribonuclease H-like domain containing protein [Quillaja saponaria]|uniref:Ribonuclease H-like domain containing protein n=1 Tax=Quillaja saponaria TaxID=32244 RepID=A0AAD7VFD7_QUISA|nr:Ribonuclease H-like domain containing protein [Quillaja saponaria]